MIDIKQVPEHALDALVRPLITVIRAYYDDPENQRKYEEWYLAKHGHYPANASYMNTEK